jgi:FkbM family methyltransferase
MNGNTPFSHRARVPWLDATRVVMSITGPLKARLHGLIRTFGIDVVRYVPHNFYRLRRARRLLLSGARTLFDVGAHEGEYAREILEDGYVGAIHSFEPAPKAYHILEKRARLYQGWKCYRTAIGDFDGVAVLRVAVNTASSSILPVRETTTQWNPETRQVGAIEVEVKTLSAWSRCERVPLPGAWLKIDVQGLEMHVLRGCGNALAKFCGIEVETALEPLYEGESEFLELANYLAPHGYRLTCMGIGGVSEATGEVLYIDAIFEPCRGSAK